jgi:hypothetical protein
MGIIERLKGTTPRQRYQRSGFQRAPMKSAGSSEPTARWCACHEPTIRAPITWPRSSSVRLAAFDKISRCLKGRLRLTPHQEVRVLPPALAAYLPDGSIRSIADRQMPCAASVERP